MFTRRLRCLAIGLLLAVGCSPSGSGGFLITQPKPVLTSPAPARDSPGGVLRLLKWCYDNRNAAIHRTLFTDDFCFVFGALDPSGAAYRETCWTRDDEIAYFDHLVNGGDANQPAAQSITLLLDRNFRVTDNPYKPGAGHRLIRTSVMLKVVTDQSRDISGFANFFLVRGDSAAIPDELKLRGFVPDSTQWWIERWEDDTFQEDHLARAMPTQKATWGSLKALYR